MPGTRIPDNDSDDNRAWYADERQELVALYEGNEDMDVRDLARQFATTKRAVVIALAEELLFPHGALVDPALGRSHKAWTISEIDAVHDAYRAGASLPEISRLMRRDQLSVAFRLIEDRLPDVARIEEYSPLYESDD